jgi:hypothetical protein
MKTMDPIPCLKFTTKKTNQLRRQIPTHFKVIASRLKDFVVLMSPPRLIGLAALATILVLPTAIVLMPTLLSLAPMATVHILLLLSLTPMATVLASLPMGLMVLTWLLMVLVVSTVLMVLAMALVLVMGLISPLLGLVFLLRQFLMSKVT